MNQACDIFLTAVIIVLGLLCLLCVVRSIIGPRIADRIVAVNMIGTMTMMIIAILTVKMKEGFLADVAIIYAMISFLAVVVLVKVYLGVYREHEAKAQAGPPKTHPAICSKKDEAEKQLSYHKADGEEK